MTTPKRGHCSNREIVHADKRLHSPNYDDEGDPGLNWYELIDADAMCFWGMCGHDSYNAWVKATDAYINGEGKYKLTGHYLEVKARAEAMLGGAALPLDLSDKFNEIVALINAWNEAGYRPDKTLADDFRHPIATYWWGEIRQIIEYFDRAACLYDELDRVAIEVLKQPSLAKGAPVRTLEEIPGGYLGGHGGPSGDAKPSGRSPLGMAVGIIAIGAAGYFGFKVLTE